MAQFSFDIVSTYDKAEMNNAFAQTEREIGNRYDFKDSPAAIEWIGDKKGVKITGSSEWQVESILDIFRLKLATRDQGSSMLNLDSNIVTANLKVTQDITFKEGLDKEKAKQITTLLRTLYPKAKASIQGDTVRVSSTSKDELQKIITAMTQHGFDFPLSYTNFR